VSRLAAPPVQVSVLVADDRPLFLDAIGRVVHQDAGLRLVGAEADGHGALAAIRTLRPAVAVLSADLPGLAGGEVLRALARDGLSGTRTVLLVDRCTPDRAYDALARGATGCLDKRTTHDELRRAIVAAGRGESYLAAAVQAAIATEIRLREAAERPLLSARELQVLERIAGGQALPTIAGELHLGLTTVKTHAAHLYARLGVSDRAAAVAEAMRRGIIT
jgi:two-component system, NarL family, nitrate/nitrite response regulator NarL